jgi:hypothetical protein
MWKFAENKLRLQTSILISTFPFRIKLIKFNKTKRLKKLQLNKKESSSSFILMKEASSSKLTSIISSSSLGTYGGGGAGNSPSSGSGMNGASGHSAATEWDANYEEVVVTIKKSERGFGFELRNGILIIAVYPSKRATIFSCLKHFSLSISIAQCSEEFRITHAPSHYIIFIYLSISPPNFLGFEFNFQVFHSILQFDL